MYKIKQNKVVTLQLNATTHFGSMLLPNTIKFVIFSVLFQHHGFKFKKKRIIEEFCDL